MVFNDDFIDIGGKLVPRSDWYDADQTRINLQRQIEAMPVSERRGLTPDAIRLRMGGKDRFLRPGEIDQLISHTNNLNQYDEADKYFQGGPEVLDPSNLGPLTGSQYGDATRAPGTVSPWTQLQISNLQGDVASEKAALPGQIQAQGRQAVEQSAQQGGVSTRRISQVPVFGQRQAMMGRQKIGQAGALGEQGLRVQDEENRRKQLAGATGQEQSMMGTQLAAWAGKKIGEAY